MANLIVVENPQLWPLHHLDAQVVSARSYLGDTTYSQLKGARVFNLCRSYRYQSLGYYVSLLATARGHRHLPSVLTIQDMKSQTIIRSISEDLDQLIQHGLASLSTDRFTLSIYFGRNVAKRYDRLSSNLFNLLPAPLLRAFFVKGKKWQLQSIGPIGASGIPEEHRDFLYQCITEHFSGRRSGVRRKVRPRYDLAILHNPNETYPPSDDRALKRFIRAAETAGLQAELIRREEGGRLLEFDALFIRETTSVNHYTYRMARKAAAEGLVVIDDPLSILRCSNKVFLSELMERHRVPCPRTALVNRDNLETVVAQLGLPCILKQPDSSFSQGVIKVDTPVHFVAKAEELLARSDLIIAQEFIPTSFDWRIGIIDRQPLYACKYYMAHRHWQIIKRVGQGKVYEGRNETLRVEEAPARVVRTALRAAHLIGDGFYGVDIKESGGRCLVIEVNDNPSIEAGVEDQVLGQQLYQRIMEVFCQRIEKLKGRLR